MSDQKKRSGDTLIKRTYERLREDIVDGALAPGTKLRVEHLKTRYEVGAGTLRESITLLVSDALVIAEGQRGFRVAPISPSDFADLTHLRIHIEIDALRESMRQGGAEWRAMLTRAYEEISRYEQPLRPEAAGIWENLNTAFHEALLAGYESPWTFRLLRLLARQSERYRRYAIRSFSVGRDVHAEHTDIYESVMSGNDLRAALALEAHIRLTADLVSERLTNGDGFAASSAASASPERSLRVDMGRSSAAS